MYRMISLRSSRQPTGRRRIRPKLVLPLAGLLLLACIGFCAASDGRMPTSASAATDEGLAVYFSPSHNLAARVVTGLRAEQHPQIEKDRSGAYFPLCVVA